MRQELSYLLVILTLTSALSAQLCAGENLIVNPSFDDLSGWAPLWVREAGQGQAEISGADEARSKPGALKITYRGEHDWSVAQSRSLPVAAGEIYALSGWVKCQQVAGSVQLSVVLKDQKDQTLNWLYGLQASSGTHAWKRLESRFMIPDGAASIQVRVTGEGKGTSFVDDLTLERVRVAVPAAALPDAVTLKNDAVQLTLDGKKKTFEIAWPRSKRTYTVRAWSAETRLLKLEHDAQKIELTLEDSGGNAVAAAVELTDAGQVLFRANGSTAFEQPFEFPGALLSSSDQAWVVPLNEGLLVPANDPYFKVWDLVLYSGHGLCMPFLGLSDGNEALLAIAETQDDARVRFYPPENSTHAGSAWSFQWQASRGTWRYERRLHLQWVPEHGYVGIAKAYREYARSKGLLVTLKEKAKTVPAVDQLIGAVDLWYWKDGPAWQGEDHPQTFAAELKQSGVTRVLWAQKGSPESIAALNKLGFLTGRYDIVQDVWPPNLPFKWLNTRGWPEDIVLLPDGTPMKGWVHVDKDGKEYPGGVINSERGLVHLKENVTKDLKDSAYGARFLDTTTAAQLKEDYSPAHPQSRSDDRKQKMAQLAYLSQDCKLVTGSETGMDMAVPYLHYFEGMMSLGPYRLPNSGYDLFSLKEPQADYLRFQVGPFYRIPLFELVYHDCVVSTWYWGDSSNRLPQFWTVRDQFNALYGTPPLWTIDEAIWKKFGAEFAPHFSKATEIARRTGYSEMLSHAFLTADHTVQTTEFADGTRVWVNFGDVDYALDQKRTVKAHESYWETGR